MTKKVSLSDIKEGDLFITIGDEAEKLRYCFLVESSGFVHTVSCKKPKDNSSGHGVVSYLTINPHQTSYKEIKLLDSGLDWDIAQAHKKLPKLAEVYFTLGVIDSVK